MFCLTTANFTSDTIGSPFRLMRLPKAQLAYAAH